MNRRKSLTVLALTTATIAASALPASAASGGKTPLLARQGIALKKSAVTAKSLPPNIEYSLASDSRSEVDALDPVSGKTTRVANSTALLTAAAWSAATGRYYYNNLYASDSGTALETDDVPESGGAPLRVLDGALSFDLSPDASEYVYTGKDGNLYKVASNGADPVRLTGAGGIKPRISPDGLSIVFTRVVNKNSDVYIIKMDGTGLKRITASAAADFSGVFSPDSNRLLFTRAGKDSVSIYAVNLDGTGLRLVQEGAGDPDWAANGWITFLAPDKNKIVQIAVKEPGIDGKAAFLTHNGLDTTELRFKSGIPPVASPAPTAQPG